MNQTVSNVLNLIDGTMGAVTALKAIETELDDDQAFLELTERFLGWNLKGKALWVCFKDHAGQDAGTMLRLLEERTATLFEVVNAELGEEVLRA